MNLAVPCEIGQRVLSPVSQVDKKRLRIVTGKRINKKEVSEFLVQSGPFQFRPRGRIELGLHM